MPAAQANNKPSPTDVIVIHAGPDDKSLVTDPMAGETTNIEAFKEGPHTEKTLCDQLDASAICPSHLVTELSASLTSTERRMHRFL